MYAVGLVWFWSLWQSMRTGAGPMQETPSSPSAPCPSLVVMALLLPLVLWNVRRAPLGLSLLALLLAGLTAMGGTGLLPGGMPPLAPLATVLSILAVPPLREGEAPPSAKQQTPEVGEVADRQADEQAGGVTDVGDRADQARETKEEPADHHGDQRTVHD